MPFGSFGGGIGALPTLQAPAVSAVNNFGQGLIGQGNLGPVLNPRASQFNALGLGGAEAGNLSTLQALLLGAAQGGGFQAQFGKNRISIGGGGGGDFAQNLLMSKLLNSGAFAPPQNPNKGTVTMTQMGNRAEESTTGEFRIAPSPPLPVGLEPLAFGDLQQSLGATPGLGGLLSGFPSQLNAFA